MKATQTFLFIAAAITQIACNNLGNSRDRALIYNAQSDYSQGDEDYGIPAPAPVGTQPSPTPTALPSPTPPSSGIEPLYTFTARGVGYTNDPNDTLSFRVFTRTKLKVRFRPGSQDRSIAGTNFQPQYTQLGVYIKVGATSKATPLLPVDKNGPIMDFSSAFPKSCPSSDTSCRQAVWVTIEKPNYDYWCHNFGGMYCYNTHTYVYDTHPWNGTLEIETDDTVAIESE